MLARRLRCPRLSTSIMASAYGVIHGAGSAGGGHNKLGSTAAGAKSVANATLADNSSFTVTALSRWSVLSKQLPPVEKIKHIHIYDFDNTLFKTPLPNPSLWQGHTIGLLSSQDVFVNGGWWHDNRILTATGEGIEKEEPRAWEGWWNETIVDLVRLSMKQPDALCVLLTGRSEQNFADLVKRIVASKGLEFDMVGLKPQVGPANQRFQSTMHFKQIFLDAVAQTYRDAKELRIYEDRPKHAKGFREFFFDWNRRMTRKQSRGPMQVEVIQVAETTNHLNPVVEVAEVQHMINYHNHVTPAGQSKGKLRIKKTVYFTSYMVSPEDSQKLVQLAQIPPTVHQNELIIHGNNILICPRPCPASILEKVGGLGSRMDWQVSGIGTYNDNIWAARLQPIPADAKYHSDNPVPLVVLALKKGVKPIDASKITHWQAVSVDHSFVIKTTVGEKVILRIEGDDPKEDEYESLFANKNAKRKHTGDDDRNSRNHGSSFHHGGRNENRGHHTSSRGRGRGGRDRGGRGGNRGGGRGRGRGGHFQYRSLDDVEPRPHQGGPSFQGGYDESFPPTGGGAASSEQDLQNYY